MTKKEILHEILYGMDPYLSCGVPKRIWATAIELTKEIYGEKGAQILESKHEVYEAQYAADCSLALHSIECCCNIKSLIGHLEELLEKGNHVPLHQE